MESLITAGELAKLAGTTKRTILWYDKQGVLKPVKVAQNGYRFYFSAQVLEYQMVLLLTTLGVSLGEIRTYLSGGGDLRQLFGDKREGIKNEIEDLAFRLKSLDGFTANLKETGTMIKPVIKTLKPFGVYYIEKNVAYVEIEASCSELRKMFKKVGRDFTTLAIFYDEGYRPKESRIRIGALAQPGIELKPRFKNVVKFMRFASGKVVTYTHNGSGELLSLFWKQLEEYCRVHGIVVRKGVPNFEIYRKVRDEARKQFFEIYLPVT